MKRSSICKPDQSHFPDSVTGHCLLTVRTDFLQMLNIHNYFSSIYCKGVRFAILSIHNFLILSQDTVFLQIIKKEFDWNAYPVALLWIWHRTLLFVVNILFYFLQNTFHLNNRLFSSVLHGNGISFASFSYALILVPSLFSDGRHRPHPYLSHQMNKSSGTNIHCNFHTLSFLSSLKLNLNSLILTRFSKYICIMWCSFSTKYHSPSIHMEITNNMNFASCLVSSSSFEFDIAHSDTCQIYQMHRSSVK